ncbi:MAG: FMN-binding protein, partial [Finegoldia magna]|nr:FMN-binding protein [Finegoldia magna]
VNGTRPTIEDFKSKFSNIPQDGSVEVTLEKEPDYTKVGQFRVNLIFKIRGTNEITKSYVFVKIVKPVVDEQNPEKENPKKENPEKENLEKQPDKNTIDKKSGKSQPENEKEKTKSPNSDQSNRVEHKSDKKTNEKTDLNIDTKKQDEKQKNLENLKEEIR